MSTVNERLEAIREDSWNWDGAFAYGDEHAAEFGELTLVPPRSELGQALFTMAMDINRARAAQLRGDK